MEQEQTDCPAPRCLPLIPTTHTIPPMPPSVQIPQPFPSTRPGPGQPHKNCHGPGSHEQGSRTSLMGTECTMSDAHSVLYIQRLAFALVKTRCHWLCNIKLMPAEKKNWIQHQKKNHPIKLQKRYSIRRKLSHLKLCCTQKKKQPNYSLRNGYMNLYCRYFMLAVSSGTVCHNWSTCWKKVALSVSSHCVHCVFYRFIRCTPHIIHYSSIFCHYQPCLYS